MTHSSCVPPSARLLPALALLAAGAVALTACGGPQPTTPDTTTSAAPPSVSPSSSTPLPSSTPSSTRSASATATASEPAPTGAPSSTPGSSGTSAAPSGSGPTASGAAAPATATAAASGGHGKTNCALEFCVALTFDDGPSPSTTVEILDALEARGAQATFFVIGERAAEHPSVLARMAADGHEIGNHTFSHVDLTTEDWSGMVAELSDTQAAVRAATGTTPTLVRPPWGAHTAGVDAAIEATGESRVLWNVDTMDWHHQKPEYVAGASVSRDDIVLMHDVYPSTSGAVGELVDRLQADGYVLVTVSDLRDG